MLTRKADLLKKAFGERFGGQPRVFAAPGRINIIGEHTDYSEGFVMPGAIDRVCLTAAAANGADHVCAVSGQHAEPLISAGRFARTGQWIDYVAAVRQVLIDAGIDVPGCNLLISSDVPQGAGVSSSAALEVSVMNAMLALAGRTASPRQVALWSQAAEATYVGVPCGVMDQYIATSGQAGHALLLDCRSLDTQAAPLPREIAFLVIDSTIRHRLVDGGYAARRADCEMAAHHLGVRVLRDATPDMLNGSGLPERILRRARHVVSENERVLATAKALATGEIVRVGQLMNASHASLRDDFDVTVEETDHLAAIAVDTEGVLGARQMGGGFGGSVLVLAQAEAVNAAEQAILSAYRAATGIHGSAFVCTLSDGASEVRP